MTRKNSLFIAGVSLLLFCCAAPAALVVNPAAEIIGLVRVQPIVRLK